MSKGSWHRPILVPLKVRNDNWDRIDFSRKKKNVDKKDSTDGEKEPQETPETKGKTESK